MSHLQPIGYDRISVRMLHGRPRFAAYLDACLSAGVVAYISRNYGELERDLPEGWHTTRPPWSQARPDPSGAYPWEDRIEARDMGAIYITHVYDHPPDIATDDHIRRLSRLWWEALNRGEESAPLPEPKAAPKPDSPPPDSWAGRARPEGLVREALGDQRDEALSPLRGSPRQIEWGTTIRSWYRPLLLGLLGVTHDSPADAEAAAMLTIDQPTTAKWWIDRRAWPADSIANQLVAMRNDLPF